MRFIFFVGLLGILSVGGYLAYTQKLPASLQSRVPRFLQLPIAKEKILTIDTQGTVAGATSSVEKLSGTVQTVTKIAGTIGKTASGILLATPTAADGVIDVSKIVANLMTQTENIPSTVMSQARVQYCLRVLEEATKSAAPKP